MAFCHHYEIFKQIFVKNVILTKKQQNKTLKENTKLEGNGTSQIWNCFNSLFLFPSHTHKLSFSVARVCSLDM